VGDEFLCELARRLTTNLQRMGTVGRQGGDEFIVFLPDADEAAIEQVVARLHQAAAKPIVIDGHELAVSLSTGIAVCPDDGCDFQTLLKKADAAMYHAKAAGRNTHRYFTECMNSRFATHVSISSGLRRALERDEFVVFYQPQVRVTDRAVVGVEALIRWNHPQRGLLGPAEFITIAEDAGLIVPIGAWVLREACRQGTQWWREGRPLRVAVNLSALQFRGGGLEDAVRSALDESGLPPDLLELELTETVLLNVTDDVLTTIRRLRQMGVHLSIDDFGTGYSSLAYIRRLAVTRLKIDRTFVADIDTDPEAAVIAGTIVRMAHSLGLTTVAEGVESEAVLRILNDWGCDLAQGYLFGRPVPVSGLDAPATA
jgi:predicted signal transduction protein with EAL and GGDEF domain